MRVRIWNTAGGYQKHSGITSVYRLESFNSATPVGELTSEDAAAESTLFIDMSYVAAMHIEQEYEEVEEEDALG